MIIDAGPPGTPLPFVQLDGAATFSSELFAPTPAAPSHTKPVRGDWVDNYTDTVSSVSAHDQGLGMGTITLTGPGVLPNGSASVSECVPNGGPTDARNYYDGCSLDLALPPRTYTAPEGSSTYNITAQDLVGNQNHLKDQTWPAKVDHSPPTVPNLSGGTLTGQDGQPLNGTYALSFMTTDQYSGVKQVKFYVDDLTNPVESRGQQPACGTAGCPGSLPGQFTFDTNVRNADGSYRYGEGYHTLRVSAEDPIGSDGGPAASHVSSKTFQVLIDRSPPDLTLSGSLNDSAGGFVHEGTYQLQAIATDGTTQVPGAGVKSVEFLVDGIMQNQPSACDQGTTTRTCSFALDASALTDGSHEIRVVTKDNLDQPRERHFNVELLPRTGERDSAYTVDSHRLSADTELDVNLGNGNGWVKTTDFDFASSQLDLTFDRVANTLRTAAPGEFGPGASGTFGAGVRLRTAIDGSRLLSLGDGSVLRFTRNGDGSYSGPPGGDITLKDEANGTTATLSDSEFVYTFSGSEQLVSISDPEGSQLTLAYNGDGTLATLTDHLGAVTGFAYDAAKRVTSITHSGATYLYSYTPESRLSVVTRPDGGVTRYGYDGQGRVSRVTPPTGNPTRVTYDSSGRVSSVTEVTDAATDGGPTTTYSYSVGQAVSIDPSGHQQIFQFDADLGLTDATASPLPPDFDECMDDVDDELYCQGFDRDNDAIPEVDPVYDPEPAVPLEPSVLDTTECQSSFGLLSIYCTDTPVDDEDAASAFSAGLVAPSVVTPAAAGDAFQYGIGAQAVWRQEYFDDPRFKDLHLSTWRAVIPFNIAYGKNLPVGNDRHTLWQHFATAYQRANDLRLSIMVALERKSTSEVSKKRAKEYLPKKKAYLKAVRMFREQFPRVKWFAAWNEPNHEAQPTSLANKKKGGGPKSGARYLALLQRHICRPSDNCRGVGGEFAETPGWQSYFDKYRANLTGVPLPTKWGMHAYHDVAQGVNDNSDPIRTHKTPEADYFRRKVEEMSSSYRVWLTELGSFISNRRTTQSQKQQAEEVRYIVDDLAPREHARRVYYWSFWDNRGSMDTFDTMLIKFPSEDVNDPSYAGYPTMTKYPARPAYDVYHCYRRSIAGW